MGGRPRRDAQEPVLLIVVDTSVWIDHFRSRRDLPHVQVLHRALAEEREIIVGDLIVLELLLGVSGEEEAAAMGRRLRAFTVERMMEGDAVEQAARHYRTLRAVGITVRKTVDLLIGTFCIERGYCLLHNDRDFEPMHDLLGLRRA